MSLENLSKIGLLEAHTTDAQQLGKLLDAAQRCIADARQESITNETRLDAAYRAIMQLSMAALWANGYRPGRSKPGHHQTMIQSLVHSVGLDNDQMRMLDTFRVKRNATDYTGEDVDSESVEECIKAAQRLRQQVVAWLKSNVPDLIK